MKNETFKVSPRSQGEINDEANVTLKCQQKIRYAIYDTKNKTSGVPLFLCLLWKDNFDQENTTKTPEWEGKIESIFNARI